MLISEETFEAIEKWLQLDRIYQENCQKLTMVLSYWRNNIVIRSTLTEKYIYPNNNWVIQDYQTAISSAITELILEYNIFEGKVAKCSDQREEKLIGIAQRLRVEFSGLTFIVDKYRGVIFIDIGTGDFCLTKGVAPVWIPYVGLCFGGEYTNLNCNPWGTTYEKLVELSNLV